MRDIYSLPILRKVPEILTHNLPETLEIGGRIVTQFFKQQHIDSVGAQTFNNAEKIKGLEIYQPDPLAKFHSSRTEVLSRVVDKNIFRPIDK